MFDKKRTARCGGFFCWGSRVFVDIKIPRIKKLQQASLYGIKLLSEERRVKYE